MVIRAAVRVSVVDRLADVIDDAAMTEGFIEDVLAGAILIEATVGDDAQFDDLDLFGFALRNLLDGAEDLHLEGLGLRDPGPMLFISRDTYSDSIAKLFCACFYGVSHNYHAIRCKMGYRTGVPV